MALTGHGGTGADCGATWAEVACVRFEVSTPPAAPAASLRGRARGRNRRGARMVRARFEQDVAAHPCTSYRVSRRARYFLLHNYSCNTRGHHEQEHACAHHIRLLVEQLQLPDRTRTYSPRSRSHIHTLSTLTGTFTYGYFVADHTRRAGRPRPQPRLSPAVAACSLLFAFLPSL